MRRYEILHIFARRLGLKVGRAQAILSRLQDDGLVSRPGDHRGQPPDMAEPEIVRLLLAILGESGISSASSASRTFAALTTADGITLDAFLTDVLSGPPVSLRHLIVRQSPPSVGVVVDGIHVLFGEPASMSNGSPARFTPGEAITAIAAELRGSTPEQADAQAALSQVRRALI